MAGSDFNNAFERIFGKVQENLKAFTVSDRLAGREAHNALMAQGGKFYQYTDYGEGTAQTTTQYTDMNIDTFTANEVTLTLDQESSYTFNIDEFDRTKYRGTDEFLRNRAVNALKLLKREQDGSWLNNFSSANTTFDNGDIGGTPGDPIVLAPSNAQKVGTQAVGLLERQMGEATNIFWVVDPVMVAQLAQSNIADGFRNADKTLTNGFVGRTYTGIDIFKSSYLSHEITYTSTGNVSAADFAIFDGVTFTFAAVPSAEGEVDVGGDAQTSLANLAAAINQGAGAGSAYIAFTEGNNRAALRTLRDYSASSDVTTLTVDKKGGVIAESISLTNVTAGTQIAHSIIGEFGAIELASPMGIKNLDRLEPKQATTNFLSIQQHGTAVPNVNKDKFLDVQIANS